MGSILTATRSSNNINLAYMAHSIYITNKHFNAVSWIRGRLPPALMAYRWVGAHEFD